MTSRNVRRRGSRRVLFLLLGLLLGLVLGLTVLGWLARSGVPPIVRSDLDTARQLWRAQGPGNYRLQLRVGGRRAGVIELQVRDGQVVAFARDGHTPEQTRTWQYWSVPGMFDMIEQDFDSADDPGTGFGAPPGAQVIMRGVFDPDSGLPRRYQRYILGTPLDVEWEVTHFEAL